MMASCERQAAISKHIVPSPPYKVQISDKYYSKPTPLADTNMFIQILSNFKSKVETQLQIVTNISHNTIAADKVIRFISNLLKFVRTFKLLKNLKAAQRLSIEIGQLRRLIRLDRLCMILRDYHGYLHKQKLSGLDYYMAAFRAIIVWEDCNDIATYLIQLGVFTNKKILPQLKKRIADLYFLQCIGWLIYYLYQYFKADTQQQRKRNKLLGIRYTLDCIISHNQFSGKIGSLDPRIASVLGILSSLLNLSLIWK